MKPQSTTSRNIVLHSIEDLMDKRIVTADGKTLGHVIDIQLSRDGENRVIALMIVHYDTNPATLVIVSDP